MMIVHFCGLSRERIAHFGAMEEHDVALDTKGQSATTVHNGGKGDIGQPEENATLTDTSGIEMLWCDQQFGAGKTFANLF